MLPPAMSGRSKSPASQVFSRCLTHNKSVVAIGLIKIWSVSEIDFFVQNSQTRKSNYFHCLSSKTHNFSFVGQKFLLIETSWVAHYGQIMGILTWNVQLDHCSLSTYNVASISKIIKLGKKSVFIWIWKAEILKIGMKMQILKSKFMPEF